MKLGLVYPYNCDGDPPVGLASIATYLREYLHFNGTRIIDVNFEDPLEVVRRWKPDVVGISAMTGSYGESIRTARAIKQEFDIPIVIGGVHLSTLPTSLHDVFDFGVVGEGEQTALELMQLYEKEGGFPAQKLRKIPGLVVHKNKGVAFTGTRSLITPLDIIPSPDRKFTNKAYYKPRLIFWGEESYGRRDSILTARGCPYRCTFCSTSKFWQTIRFHSPEHVAREIKMLVEDYRIDHISVLDDLFTCNKKRIVDITRMLEEEGILDKVTFGCMARANVINSELCGLLKRLNVKNLNFGFESGSDRVLASLKKDGVTVEKIKKAVDVCKKHAIHVSGSFIFGSPGETLRDMEQTVDLIQWMAKAGVDRVWTFVMTPYPGTEVWDIAKKRGKVSDDMDWERVGNQLYDVDNPSLLDDSIDKGEFKNVWMKANAELEKMSNPQRRLSRLRMRIRHEPVKTIKQVVYNPVNSISFLGKVAQSVMRGTRHG